MNSFRGCILGGRRGPPLPHFWRDQFFLAAAMRRILRGAGLVTLRPKRVLGGRSRIAVSWLDRLRQTLRTHQTDK